MPSSVSRPSALLLVACVLFLEYSQVFKNKQRQSQVKLFERIEIRAEQEDTEVHPNLHCGRILAVIAFVKMFCACVVKV